MRALLSEVPGGPQTLVMRDVDVPVPKAGEILVRVVASAINYPDALIIEDRYQIKPERPFSPGGEFSGVVEAVGEGVTTLQPGDRVLAFNAYGALAEYTVVQAGRAFAIPDAMDHATAASLLMTYGTAIHALADRARLQAGERLLVLGAAGGIGIATIELGKAMGGRVIAAVSSEDKADAARQAGADEAIVYARGPLDRAASRGLADRFKAASGGEGFDVVLDPVGGDYAEPGLRALAWEGRYLVVGFTAGIPQPPLNLVLLKNTQIVGVFWGAWANREPAAFRASVERLFDLWREGRIRPLISRRYPFEQAPEAIAHLASRQATGKVVVDVVPQ